MHRLAPGALQKPVTVTFILTGKENAGIANVACILRIMSGLGHGIRMEKKVSLASQSVTDLVSHNRRQIEASLRFSPHPRGFFKIPPSLREWDLKQGAA